MNPDYKKKLPRIFFFLAALLLMVKVIREKDESIVTNHVTGQTMGTIPYSIKYKTAGAQDYQFQIDSVLRAFNQSLSTYIPNSEISRFNRYDTLVYETSMFYPVLEASRKIHELTNGAFDPTIGPLVNAWGFGPGKDIKVVAQAQIDSLLEYVGFDNIQFNRDYAIKKSGVYLDFSAIAKGYAIDLVADFLVKKGVTDYMVEIGGEVGVQGTNDKGYLWSIGIEDPLVSKDEQKVLAIARVENRALATSGNYRNYFERDGKIYAHIIDPRTGYTSNQSILSATVFAPDCMTADAYATAFMVIGVDEAMKIVNADPLLDALLIFQTDSGESVIMTENLKDQVTLDEAYR